MSGKTKLMTTEEFLALPDDGVERWLIRSQLRERSGEAVSNKGTAVRGRERSLILTRVAWFLSVWLDGRPEPRGEILAGGVGVRLRHNPDTTVGMDVVYVDAEFAARPDDHRLIDGAPILVVDVVSPKDTVGAIHERIDECLAAGVRLVWCIHPHRRTITIYRPGSPPEMVNDAQDLAGDPELPGFCVAVALLFS
jgi:Uma2 family endonuclease